MGICDFRKDLSIMRSKVLRSILTSILFVSLIMVYGCAERASIGKIKSDPLQYENKQVTIRGTVGETLWFAVLTKGGYQLGDDSGTIWVITNRPPPQKGSIVTSKGTVSTAVKLGDTTLGTVINEEKRN